MGKRALLRAMGWLLFVTIASAIVACSLVLGLKDGDYQGVGDAGDGGPIGDERAVLKPDASTATCDGVDGSFARSLAADSDSVFVLQGGSTIVSSCGTKVNPCGTIAVGIEVANANRAKAIFIGPGTYAEKLNIPSGVSVEGGFQVSGAEWTALCENITTIIAPPDAIAVEADNVLSASLRFLTVETKAHGDPGESLFGVYANQSVLLLENVNIYAELGGIGSTGAAGTGNDTTDKSCSGAGLAGNPGTPGAAGTFSATGYDLGSAGGVGSAGARGGSGTHTAPTCSTSCIATCTTYTYPTDDAGVPIDDAGNELPDASPTECQSTTKGSTCGSDVATACGGTGGLGGAGGGNGAASVAVFATGSGTVVTITGGALVSAGGGLGGPGGGGASGANGEVANAGASAQCFGTCDSTCMQANPSALSGGSTTAGVNGGAGGAGGGGAGGPTFLIVTASGATVVPSQTNQWQVPTAGAAGGNPNGPAGAFGKQSP